MSSGTFSPASQIAFIAPIADGSLTANTASMRGRTVSSRFMERSVALHEAAVDEPLRLDLNSSRLVRVAPAFFAALGVDDIGAADVRDRLAAQIQKMRRREHADTLVIGQHAMAVDARMIVAIDHHDCRAESCQLPQQILVRRTVHRREDDAVDLAAAQHLELGALFPGSSPELHSSNPYPRTLATGSIPAMISTKNDASDRE